MCIDTLMKRFSRKWFSQIMIHKLLKKELEELKSIVSKEVSSTHQISYGDVITFLIKEFKEKRKIEYPIDPKLLIKNSFSGTKLNASIPLRKTSLASGSKLDGKQRVSYSLES